MRYYDYENTKTKSSKTKSSASENSKSAKKFSTSASSSGFSPTPGECSLPFRGCGRGASCWRFKLNGRWYNNAICVPDGQCLPRNTWVLADSGLGLSDMRERCCSGDARMGQGAFSTYYICL